MLQFLIGFLLAHAMLCNLALHMADRSSRDGLGENLAVDLALRLVVVPVAVAWLVAELHHTARPRRALCMPARASEMLVGYGIATGAGSLALGAAALALLDGRLGDMSIVAGAAAAATLLAIALLPRRRRGRCLFCDYDLRATGASRGPCPECGAAQMA